VGSVTITELTPERAPLLHLARGRAGRLRVALGVSSSGLLLLGLLVGSAAGLAAVGFRELISLLTQVFSGHADYSTAGHAANHWVPWLGPAFVIVSPAVAGLIYGPLVRRFAPEARGHGVPEVMFAVAERGGRIPAKVAVVKSLASALTIGSGGSVGREGPIVQIGSALGSSVGRLIRAPESRLRLLVASGAAAGISATFNTPIAGVVFALELIVQDFQAESFGVVVVASVTADVIGRAAFGDSPFLHLPAFTAHHPGQYLLFALLGLLAGASGVAFTKVLYAVEDACDWLWRGPEWLRPGVGGLLLGLLLLAVPQMYGVGYPVLQKGVDGDYAVGFLLLLLVAKVLATSLTIGIGGSGGVFAPSLFCGAMLGEAVGLIGHQIAPATIGSAGAYALIGMGAFFAGSARAPITAVIILFELTGEYTIILPLMLAVVLATSVSRALTRDTIYTLKLARRGITLSQPGSAAGVLRSHRVASCMHEAPSVVSETLGVSHLLGHLSASGVVLVSGDDGTLYGVVTAHAVAEAMSEPGGDRLQARELASAVGSIAPEASLTAALAALNHDDGTGIAVVDGAGDVVGWIDHRAVLSGLLVPAAEVGSHG
jgi:CIC family chloride channel protein